AEDEQDAQLAERGAALFQRLFDRLRCGVHGLDEEEEQDPDGDRVEGGKVARRGRAQAGDWQSEEDRETRDRAQDQGVSESHSCCSPSWPPVDRGHAYFEN